MSKRIELSWKRFWKLSVQEYLYWKDVWYRKCICDCWNVWFFTAQDLIKYNTKDCWCSKKLVWRKFWKLLVIKDPKYISKFSNCRCLCECWWEIIVKRNNLITWNTKSCWCIRKLKPNSLRHWKYWTKIYKTWKWIKNRCNNKKDVSFPLYWWRWIKCLWTTFEEFEKDMSNWCVEWLSLDRIDVNWNYCKENCRRATAKEQANNRRTNKIITLWNISLNEKQWEEKMWFKRWIISYRLSHWWSIEKALLTKSKKWN